MARLLARAYRGNQFREDAVDDAVAWALKASAHRQAIVWELEFRLHDRDFAPSYGYIYTLSEARQRVDVARGHSRKTAHRRAATALCQNRE